MTVHFMPLTEITDERATFKCPKCYRVIQVYSGGMIVVVAAGMHALPHYTRPKVAPGEDKPTIYHESSSQFTVGDDHDLS